MKIAKDAFKSVLPFNLEIQEIRRTQEQIEQRFKKRAMQTEHNKMHRAEKLFEQQQLAERYSDQKNLQGQIVNMEVV